MILGRETQGSRLGEEFLGQLGEVIARKSPIEGRRHALVVLLEAQQSILDLIEAGEIIGSEGFALDDGEIDLDLVKPTGVNRTVNGNQVGIGLGEASHTGLAAMGGAVIHDPEHAPRVAVGCLTHDLVDEAAERIDAGGFLATTKDLGTMHIERRQVGPRPGARVLVFDASVTVGARW